MKATQGSTGRVFILRLEDGDVVPSCIERFAEDKHVDTALVFLIGGMGSGEIVVGPRNSHEMPPLPMLLPVDGAHEVVAVGLLALGEGKKPVLHIHGSLGRSGQTMTGCLRPGIRTWLVGEAVLYEITGVDIARRHDHKSGFTLLEVE